MDKIDTTEIKQIELEIKFYKNQTVQSVFEVGERLIRAKSIVPHGEWENWLNEKVDFSQERARQIMIVTKEYSNSKTSWNISFDKMFMLTSLKSEERETFIEDNPVEDMTTRELRQAIKEKKELEEKVKELEEREPEIVEKTIEKIPDDYEYLKDSNEKLRKESIRLNHLIEDKDIEINYAKQEKEILERKARLNEKDSNKYKQLQNQIENLSKQKDDLGRQVRAATELSGFAVRMEKFLKNDLAPIKYSRALREAKDDEIVKENLKDIVDRVQEWCNEMYQYTSDENIIYTEVITND